MQIKIIGVSLTSIVKVTEITSSSSKAINYSVENGDIIFSYDISNKIKVEDLNFDHV
jgi:hypothetical protein